MHLITGVQTYLFTHMYAQTEICVRIVDLPSLLPLIPPCHPDDLSIPCIFSSPFNFLFIPICLLYNLSSLLQYDE